jgi:TP901 family phage tail tape measure protein
MADMNSNININIDTAQAMAQLRALERQLTSLNRSLIVGSKQNAVYQKQFAQSLMANANATGKFTASMTTMQTATEQFSNRLDRGKLSLREYYRYSMASTQTFGRRFGKEYDVLGKTIQKRVKMLQTSYVQLGRDAQGSMRAMQFVPKRLNYDDINTKLQIAIQRQQIFNRLLMDGSTRLLNFGKNTQWAGRQLMVGFTIPLVMLGAQAVRTFKEIEEQSIRFRKVYGDAFTNEKQTQEALGNIRTLAREYTKYGLKIQDTMRIAADAAQMGNTGAELVAQVKEANKLAILGGVDQEKALETTISLTNSFGIAAQDLSSKINFLNAVENQTILSLEDITKAAPIAGNVVKQLGGDVEDLAFFLTAMREGGINANQGANALKSGLARLINPTNTAVKKLNEFGIDILGIVERNTGNVKNTVLELATSLETLGSTDRARAIETIFGKFQFTRLSTLLQNVTKQGGQAARVLEVAAMEAEELAILSEREMKVQADSPMNRLASSIERLKEQLAPIGEIFAKALIPVAEFFTKMFEKFNNLPEGVKKAIAIVVGAIGTIGPVLLMTVGLVANGIANMMKLFIMLRKGYQQLAFGSTDAALKTQYLTNEEIENTAITNNLYTSHQRLSGVYALEAKSLSALTAVYDRAAVSMMRVAGTNPRMFMPGAASRATTAGRLQFNQGTLSVPGTGNKDTVESMLTPGEAVIPKEQSKKYRGLISGIIQDKVPGFVGGIANVAKLFMPRTRLGVVQSGMGAGRVASGLNWPQIPWTRDPSNPNMWKIVDPKSNRSYSFDAINKTKIDAKYAELAAKGKVPAYGARGEMTPAEYLMMRLQAGKTTPTKIFGNLSAGGGAKRNRQAPKNVRTKFANAVKTGNNNKIAQLQKEFDDEARYLNSVLTPAELQTLKKQGFSVHVSHREAVGASRGAEQWTRDKVLRDTGVVNFGLNYLTRSGKRLPSGTKHPTTQSEANNILSYLTKMPANEKTAYTKALELVLKRRVGNGFYQRNNISDEALGLNKGIFSVPGPNVNKDVVPAMLTPGEAVIPRDQAQKYRPLISGIIADKVPGFNRGTDGVAYESFDRDERLSNKANARIRNELRKREALMRKQNRMTETEMARQLRREKDKLINAEKQKAAQIRQTEAMNRATKATETQTKEQKKNSRQEKRMRFAGAMGKASMASFMIPMVAGGYAAQNPDSMVAKNMMPIMLASMIPILLPLFTSIPMAIAAAVTAVVGGIWMYNKKQNDAIKEQARLVDEISATTEKMKEVGQLTGKVGATELMARKRERGTGEYSFTERDGISFGSTFMQSEIGKVDFKAFQDRFELMPERAMKEFALKLASYVSDGVLDTAQAVDITKQIGVELGNETLGINLRGKLLELVTLEGKDIMQSPFEIRLQIARESMQQLSEFTNTRGLAQEYASLEVQLQQILNKYNNNLTGMSFEDQEKRNQLVKQMQSVKDMQSAASSTAGAIAAQSLESIQAQIDGIDVYTNKEIEKLEQQKKTTKDLEKQQKIQEQINELELKRTKTVNQLEGSNRKVLDSLQTSLNIAKETGKQNNFFVGLNEAITNKFKGGPQEVQAKQFNKLASTLGDKGPDADLRARLQTLVASDLLGPLQGSGLLNLFAGDNKSLDKTLNLFIKGAGIQNLNKVQDVVGGFEDKDLAKDVLVKFGSKKDKAFDEAYNTLDLLRQLGGEEVNVEAFLKVNGGKDFDQLSTNLSKIAALPDVNKKATIEAIETMNGFTTDAKEGLTDKLGKQWKYFASLDPNVRKTAIQTYLSIFSTMFTDPEARKLFAYEKAAETISQGGSPDSIERKIEYRQIDLIDTKGNLTKEGVEEAIKDSIKKTKDIINAMQAAFGGGDSKKKTEAGKTEPSFLDDILKKLRDVRDNTIKVTKGFDASMKGLKKILSGGKDIKIFSGIEQDLNRLGLGDSFIDLITGMDPEEFKKRKNELFEFDNKKNIVGLKEDANVIKKALLEIALGDFQSKQLGLIKNTQNQTKAVQRLVASGMSATDAFKAVEDTAFAAAVASDELKDDELKKVVKTTNQASKEMSIFASKANLAQKALDFKNLKDIPKAIQKARQSFGELPESVIQAIIDDPDIRNVLLDPKFDPKDLQQALQDAANRAQLEVDIKMLTQEGRQSLFDEGMSKAMEWFDAQETKIELDFEFKVLNDKNIIDDAQDAIDLLEYRVDDLQAELVEIEDAEKVINDKYDERIKALDKVSKINQDILDQQKSQLTIADALTQGDIGAAAKAVQDMRAQQASSAIDRQQESLEASRELEISSIRNSLGRTRAQIEKEIKDLQKQIFDIEEKTLEPAQERVRLAEVEKREAIEKLTLLGKTKLEWEAVKNRVDLARTSSQEYMEAIKRALDLTQQLVDEYNKIKSKEVVITIIKKEINEGGGSSDPTEYTRPDPKRELQIAPAAGIGIPKEQLKSDLKDLNGKIGDLKSKINQGGLGPKALENKKDNLEELQLLRKQIVIDLGSYNNISSGGGSGMMQYQANGGLVKYMNMGGMIKVPKAEPAPVQRMNMGGVVPKYMPMGGLVPYMNMGGIFKPKGTDTVPAMLTPGEFVVRKYAVQDFGLDRLKAINSGTYNDGSVYNYNLNVNVKSESNPDDIANVVMMQIKRIDAQRIRGNRF